MNHFTYRMLLDRLQCMSEQDLDQSVCVFHLRGDRQILYVQGLSSLNGQPRCFFDRFAFIHNPSDPFLVI